MSTHYDLGQCQWFGWAAETDNDNDDDREGVYYLTIADEDGEELATIIHRLVGGKYPLDGEVAKSKERVAQQIVDALNAARETGAAQQPDSGSASSVEPMLPNAGPAHLDA